MKKILDKLNLFLFGNHEDEILENRIFHIISFTAGATCLISVFINLLNDFPLLLNIVVAISGLIFLLFYYLSAFKKKTSRVKLPFLIIFLVILPFAWFYNQGIEGSVPYYFFLVTAIFIFCLPQHKAWTILLLFIAFAVALIALQFLFPHLIIQYPDKQTQIEDLSFSLILALFILGVLIIAVKKSYDKERLKTDKIIATSPGVICSFRQYPDGSSCFPFASPAIEDVFGFLFEEVRKDASKIFALIHPDDVEHVFKTIAESAKTMLPWIDEYRYKHPQKGEVWIKVNSIPICESDGSIIWHGIITDITKRKKAEEALQRSEMKFRTLYESTEDAVILSDNKGFFECNTAALKMFGCATIEELNMKGDTDFSPPLQPCGTDSLTLANKKREEALTKGNIHFEWVHKRVDTGETFPAEVLLKRIELNDYQIHQTVVRNITERKKAEEALHRSETKFRSLYETSSDAVMLLNEKGFFDCNTAALKLFGCATKEEFYTKNPVDLSPPFQPCGTDSMTLANQRIAEAMEKGSNKFDWVHKRVDSGELFPADVLLSRMELDGAQVLQATVRDITQRKKTEKKIIRISDTQSVLNDVLLLTFQEQSLHETLGKVLDIILSVKWLALDAKGSIFLVKEKPNELVLIASRNLHDSLLSTCAIVPFGRCLCGRAALHRDIIFSPCLDETHENTYTGIKPHGHYCVPIIHEDILLGVINVYVKENHLRKDEDVKFLKAFAALVAKIIVHYKTQEEIKMLAENLIEKNKDVEQFAYIISHDLQEPLRTINNFIDLIGKEFADKMDGDFKQYFEFIEQATNRMRTLIKNVLDYSRLGKNNQLMKVNCDTLLNDISVDLNAIIKESHAQIKFENLPVIHAFPIELKQLFQNLIVNAIKFRKKDVPPEIIITAKKVKPDWVFAVQDNGIGINKKHQEKIFQIFQRLHNRDEYEGTGIGLSFCKKIAELHEGKIWIESKEGEGSTFYFSISDTLLSA